MPYLSTTQLRTQTKSLVNSLNAGKSVFILHRSQLVGKIVPMNKGFQDTSVRPFNVQKFLKLANKLSFNLPKSDSERRKAYKQHLEKKYGPISRH